MIKLLVKTLLLPFMLIPLLIDYIDLNLSFPEILEDYYDNE